MLASVDATALLGAWCTTISVAFVWPQVWRVWRHDTTHGLSPFATVHNIVGSNNWFVYGVLIGRPAGWLANVSFTAAMTMIALAQIRHKVMNPWLLAAGFAVSGLASWAAAAVSTPLAGWLAIATSTSAMAPQFLHVVRTHNLHGISIPSMVLTVTSSFSWLSYGVAIGDPLFVIPQLLFIPANSYILLRAHRWHSDPVALGHGAGRPG